MEFEFRTEGFTELMTPWTVADVNSTAANPLNTYIGIYNNNINGDTVYCTQCYIEVTYTVPPPPTINNIDIGGAWKTVTQNQINISGVWKDITQMQINIGGVWKDLTS